MYILKHILLFMALIIVDITSTVIIVNAVKSSFLNLPLYIYSGIGSSVVMVSMMVYLPLYYKLKDGNMHG